MHLFSFSFQGKMPKAPVQALPGGQEVEHECRTYHEAIKPWLCLDAQATEEHHIAGTGEEIQPFCTTANIGSFAGLEGKLQPNRPARLLR